MIELDIDIRLHKMLYINYKFNLGNLLYNNLKDVWNSLKLKN